MVCSYFWRNRVAAGTAIIGNVFEDQFERISKIEFEVDGNLEEPKLRRL